jgi:hypothetical protein
MSTVQAVAIVMAIVQFAKKLFPTIVKDVVATVLAVVCSVGVTAYKYLSEGLPFDFSAIMFAVQVIIGATAAYGLIKVASGSGTTPR